MRVRSVTLTLGLLAAVPAFAQTQAPVAAPKTVKVERATDKVCKRVPKTGSNIGTERVCMTRTDWNRATEETRQTWDEMRGKGMTSGQ